YFGYVYPGKGIEDLLEAMRLAIAAHDPVRLVVVGGTNEVILREAGRPDYLDELKRMAAKKGMTDQVTWTGYYPSDTDRPSLYLRAADACVLPFCAGVYLNNSSFSAAAAHSLPVITTRGAVVEPAFQHNRNVMLCPPQDPQALAEAIHELV